MYRNHPVFENDIIASINIEEIERLRFLKAVLIKRRLLLIL